MSWSNPHEGREREGRFALSLYSNESGEGVDGGEGFQPLQVEMCGAEEAGAFRPFVAPVCGSESEPTGDLGAETVTPRVIDEEFLQQVREEAFREGFAAGTVEGEQVGYAKKAEEVDGIIERHGSLQQELVEELQRVVVDVERRALTLSLEIARKIILETPHVRPEYIGELLERAFQSLNGKKALRVRVSPEDRHFIEEQGLSVRLAEGVVEFVADVSPGE
jgi:hypothetical protein